MRFQQPNNVMKNGSANSRSVLMLVNADITDRQRHEPESTRGPHRRADFYEMAELLGAEVIDWSTVRASFIGRSIQRLTNWYVAAAVLAFLRHRRYQLIWCDGEPAGSLLALLFKVFRVRKPLMMIGISPTRRAMWIMIRVFKVHSHITKLFAMCSWAMDTLTVSWGIPREKIELLPYQVDVDFFDAKWAEPEHRSRPYIVAVGRESRDYEVLVRAVDGLQVDLVIALGSTWAHSERDSWRQDAPSNVSVTTKDYLGLRDLYAGSAFVVIPLREIELQNGITAIQEAMSMGKAVVTSRTRGQGDLLADDQMVLQDGSGRFTGGYFARYFAPSDIELHGPTGIYVPPGDVAALRNAIKRLLGDSNLAAELGARARSVCERVVSLDCFLERVAEATKPYLI
jgi:glycosyltransferase involved in cell wall biosynthesis